MAEISLGNASPRLRLIANKWRVTETGGRWRLAKCLAETAVASEASPLLRMSSRKEILRSAQKDNGGPVWHVLWQLETRSARGSVESVWKLGIQRAPLAGEKARDGISPLQSRSSLSGSAHGAGSDGRGSSVFLPAPPVRQKLHDPVGERFTSGARPFWNPRWGR